MDVDRNREKLCTQKLYPSVNNSDLLEFRIPPNGKGHLDLGNVLLHFKVTVPTPSDKSTSKPQNLLGPKQFSSVEVRVNGETATRRSCANEYFLASYFQHLINYSADYQTSALKPVGIYDFNQTTATTLAGYSATVKSAMVTSRSTVSDSQEYEILMSIDSSIFYTTDLLPTNTPIDLSFERIGAGSSTMFFKTATIANDVNTLNDVYLILPFVKSDNLFNLERNAVARPIKIHYDDYVIRRFNIPKSSTNVRMNNIITGNLPSKFFWAIQRIESYTGNFQESSTRFNRNNMTKANLYVDGNEVADYPVTMTGAHVTVPFVKFLQNTNQQNNGYLSRTLTLREFEDSNFILSASMDPESSGSISLEFEFSSVVNHDLVLITCAIADKTLKLDNNRNIQIV